MRSSLILYLPLTLTFSVSLFLTLTFFFMCLAGLQRLPRVPRGKWRERSEGESEEFIVLFPVDAIHTQSLRGFLFSKREVSAEDVKY